MEPGGTPAKGMAGGASANTLQPHSNSAPAKTGAIRQNRPNISHPDQTLGENL
jgi:hypothetical protein